jgi:MFS family permease
VRRVMQAGAFLVAGGLLLSSFVSHMWVLFITNGLLTGMGYALTWAPAMTGISRYFTSNRPLATGLAVSGSGFGTMAMGQLSNLLIQAYGWRSSMRVIALVSGLGNFLAACVIYPVEPAAASRASLGTDGEGPAAQRGSHAAASASARARARSASAADTEMETLRVSDVLAQQHGGAAGPDASPTRPQVDPPRAFTKVDQRPAANADAPGSAVVQAGADAPRAVAAEGSVHAALGRAGPRSEAAGAPRGGGAAARGAEERALGAGEILAAPGFAVLCVVLLIFASCIWIPFTFVAAYATGEGGLSADEAAAVVAVTGVSSTLGRIAFGRLSKARLGPAPAPRRLALAPCALRSWRALPRDARGLLPGSGPESARARPWRCAGARARRGGVTRARGAGRARSGSRSCCSCKARWRCAGPRSLC